MERDHQKQASAQMRITGQHACAVEQALEKSPDIEMALCQKLLNSVLKGGQMQHSTLSSLRRGLSK